LKDRCYQQVLATLAHAMNLSNYDILLPVHPFFFIIFEH